MFSTSDFYSYCRSHNVDVIPFDRLPAEATTVRYHGMYAVGLNFRRLQTVRTNLAICTLGRFIKWIVPFSW